MIAIQKKLIQSLKIRNISKYLRTTEKKNEIVLKRLKPDRILFTFAAFQFRSFVSLAAMHKHILYAPVALYSAGALLLCLWYSFLLEAE
jgi:hypothetical protein